MIFVTDKKKFKNAVIWNKKTDKRMCKFENGECEVTDQSKATIAHLKKLGFNEKEDD